MMIQLLNNTLSDCHGPEDLRSKIVFSTVRGREKRQSTGSLVNLLAKRVKWIKREKSFIVNLLIDAIIWLILQRNVGIYIYSILKLARLKNKNAAKCRNTVKLVKNAISSAS